MKIKNVLVIKGGSQYGQLRYESDEIILGFCEQGCIVTVLDLSYNAHLSLAEDWLDYYDLVFSYNAIGIDLYLKSPKKQKPLFWAFLVDHPFYLHPRLKSITGNVIVSCIDRRHVDYIDRFYKNIPWVCFMPHGGVIGDIYVKPYEERRYDVVMMGGLGDIKETVKQIANMSNAFAELLNPVLQLVEKDFGLDLENVVLERLEELGLCIDDNDFCDMMHSFYHIDIYRRYIKRRNLIDTLCDAGIPVDIWGNGWNDVAEKRKDLIRIHPNVPYDAIKFIMADAKIVLNDMPLFHDGSHERVFAPMQCGAVCVSDRSIFVEEMFQNMNSIVFYDLDNLSAVPSIIRELLSNNEKSIEIAMNGREISLNETWKNKAKEVIEIAEGLG